MVFSDPNFRRNPLSPMSRRSHHRRIPGKGSGKHPMFGPMACWNMVSIDDCIVLCCIFHMSVRPLKQRTPKQNHHGFWPECFIDQDKLTKLCESHRVSMHDLFTLMVPAATARDVLPLFFVVGQALQKVEESMI